ncbi:nuclease-related domain-containing protein [Microbacterium sp. HJ5]
MTEADQPPRAADPAGRPRGDLRARIAGHGVIEQLLAAQHRTRTRRPGDDHLTATLDPESESWYSGAIGEIRVGLMLAILDPEWWTVLHSVPVGDRGSDLDHLVIGPAGVFVINTKRHFGKRVWAAGHGLRIENHQVPYLRNLELEISRTEDALRRASGLSVDAVGIVAVVDAASVTVTAPTAILHHEAHVMDADALLSFLSARRRVFSDDQVARIVEAAVRPETWTRTPAPATEDGPLLRLRFEALRVRLEAGGRPIGASPRTAPSTRQRSAGRPGPKGSPVRASRRGPAWTSLLAGLAALAAAWWLFQYGPGQLTTPPVDPGFSSAAEEQAALIEFAGTTAMLIDEHSPGGTRPDRLALTPGTSVLQTPGGATLVDLPDGTAASYAPSDDLRTYTLTLTGAQFGTVVTVSPETGVILAPAPTPGGQQQSPAASGVDVQD